MRAILAAFAACALCSGLAGRSEARIIYVNRAATGAANGFSWQSAYTGIQQAINSAGGGDEVWVAAGTYVENVQLRSNVALYGGFEGTESQREDRNPAVHFTSIDGDGAGPCVSFQFSAGPQTILDGFRLRNGYADEGGGGGVFVSNRVTGRISNNVITENRATQGGGIASQYASVIIANNLIEGNSGFGAAIVAYSGEPRDPARDAPKIVNNTIVDNHGGDNSAAVAVYLGNLSGAVFANNIVSRNDWGVSVENAAGVAVENNDVSNNDFSDWLGNIGNPTGTNGNINDDPTFADVDAWNYSITPDSPAVDAGANSRAVGGTDLDNGPRLQNGQVDIGAYESDDSVQRLVFSTQPAGGAPGDWFQNEVVVQVEDAWGGIVSDFQGDITLAIDPGSGNPNASLDGTVTVSAEGGVATFYDLSVSDPGRAFVLNATAEGVLPAQSRMFTVGTPRVYVRTDGSDDEDGFSWDTAKQTVQAALDMRPLEIWVAEGTYEENVTAYGAVELFGGFAGDEESLEDRDPDTRATLDGGHNGSVLTSVGGEDGPALARLDGFIITNGDADNARGGGAYLVGFRGTIANVDFENNTASERGGGLYLESLNNPSETQITLTNVRFANNTAGEGGGLYAETDNNFDSPTTVNLTDMSFDGNVAAWGGGANLHGGDFFFTGSTSAANNVATLGGGIFVQAHADINSAVFTHNGTPNAPADAAGGAIYVENGGYLSATDVSFEDNYLVAPGHAAVGGAVAGNGGGFSLYAVTMRNNIADRGGAIYSTGGGSASVSHATVMNNTGRVEGGGAFLSGGPVYVESSLFASNIGGGVILDHAPLYQSPAQPARLLNNTIAANPGVGLDIRSGSLVSLLNNIVAFNGAGVRMDALSRAAFYSNDVFGNAPGGDFVGFAAPTGTLGNISADPLFVNRANGDFHLAANSPAVDAGDSGPYNWYYQDLDNNPRVQGPRVDIGAYELTSTRPLNALWSIMPQPGPGPGPLAVQPRIEIRDGNGQLQTSFNGSVTVAIKPGTGTTGATLGGTTTVPVVNGVATFTDLSISKGGTGYILTATFAAIGGSDSSAFNVPLPIVRVAVDGDDAQDGSSWATAKRTVQAAADQTAPGGSVWLKAGTYPGAIQVRGASLLGGFAGTDTDPTRDPAANPTILDGMHLADVVNVQNNGGGTVTFDGLTLQNAKGSGILAFVDHMVVSNNTFRGNAGGFGPGVLTFGNNVRITRSRFLSNTAQYGGGGVCLAGGATTVDNSLFVNNTAPQDGSAVTVYNNAPVTLVNNTIVAGVGNNGAVHLHGSAATLTNNIVVNNASGITRDNNASAPVTLSRNDVFGNAAFNYNILAAGPTDIAADPLFLNPAASDYRLASGSPAVDAGDDSAFSLSAFDLAGNMRKSGAHVDLGAFEQVTGAIGIQDAVRALQITAGLSTATLADLARLNVDNTTTSTGVVDLRDAARLTRKSVGTDPNP